MPSTQGFIVSSNFYLQTNTQTFTSPLNRTVQTVQLGGSRWIADVTLRAMKKHEAAVWIAFFLKLKGMSETFYLSDPDYKTPLGVGGGTPLVNGAGQTGTSLNIDGCPANTLRWLRAGDYFSLGDELKRLTDDVNINGSGQATLNFESRIRISPADNFAVVINQPKSKMRLVDDSQLSFVSDRNGLYSEKTFTCFEAIP